MFGMIIKNIFKNNFMQVLEIMDCTALCWPQNRKYHQKRKNTYFFHFIFHSHYTWTRKWLDTRWVRKRPTYLQTPYRKALLNLSLCIWSLLSIINKTGNVLQMKQVFNKSQNDTAALSNSTVQSQVTNCYCSVSSNKLTYTCVVLVVLPFVQILSFY